MIENSKENVSAEMAKPLEETKVADSERNKDLRRITVAKESLTEDETSAGETMPHAHLNLQRRAGHRGWGAPRIL